MIDGERMKGTEPDLANPDVIRRIVDSCRTIAIVGLSGHPLRPSHRVAGQGVCPSNPSLRGKGDAMIDHSAARRAYESGLLVALDRCWLKEYRKKLLSPEC